MRNRNDLNKFFNFLEEFSWLIESYKGTDLKKNIQFLRDNAATHENEITNNKFIRFNNNEYSFNSSTQYLVGVLPKLLKDVVLFPNNESIIQFANDTLDLNISPKGKRSRIEMIGKIVCEVDNMSSDKYEWFSTQLKSIIDSSSGIERLRTEVNNNNITNWNDMIRKLVKYNE